MFFIVSGPSGCGKSTLIKSVLVSLEGTVFSVSHTTRPRRQTEKEGSDYFFISKASFERLIREGAFVEWAKVHGHYYGTSKKEVDRKRRQGDLLLDIDVQGARQLREKFRKAEFIFVVPPSYAELRRRLAARGQNSRHSVAHRLQVAKREVESYPMFDYVVINDMLETAVEELKAVILSRRCRLAGRRRVLEPILRSFKEG